jgi:hypothetical protein
LSYAWGDISTRVPIQVNGGTLFISENLRNALIDLRYPDLPRIIWADAICINQEDAAEWVSQVASMRSIYRSASQTVVWLGPETKKTRRAFDLMQGRYEEAVYKKFRPCAVNDESRADPARKRCLDDTTMVHVFMQPEWWL